MRTLSIPIYSFTELSDSAKEYARQQYRIYDLDYEWWDAVYEDAKMCGKLLGIEIDRIYFSGFSSQGDGACFEGCYSYRPGWRKALRSAIGGQSLAKLEAIGDALQDAQRPAFYRLTASTRHDGHYCHSGCMDVTVDASDTPNVRFSMFDDYGNEFYEGVRDELRRFADWIYAQLSEEYDWLTSDEAIDEALIANEYEFTENGELT